MRPDPRPLLVLALAGAPALAQCELQTIEPSFPPASEHFGAAVDRDGGFLAVGAPQPLSPFPGEASVYRLEGGQWVIEGIVAPPDGAAGDGFGSSVSISGDRLLVGAPQHVDPFSGAVGAAYLYERDTSHAQPLWLFSTKLVGEVQVSSAELGAAVAISGDRLAIGAPSDDASGLGRGAVFVYEHVAFDSWVLRDTVVPDAGTPAPRFGDALDLGPNLLLVGAPEDGEGGFRSGALYVFARSGELWPLEQKVVPSDAVPEMSFGASVALHGGFLLETRASVGAPFRHAPAPGRAYVFLRQIQIFPLPPVWIANGQMTAGDGHAGDGFGTSVAAWELDVVVGANLHDGEGFAAGKAYWFDGVAGFQERGHLVGSSVTGGDHFGVAVALEGTEAAVAASKSDLAASDGGALHAFDLDPSACPIVCDAPRVPIPDLDDGQKAGADVAISGDWAAVVTDPSSIPGAFLPNPVRVLQRHGSCWQTNDELDVPQSSVFDELHATVAMDGPLLIVGAPTMEVDQVASVGRAYVYRRLGTTWVLEAELAPQLDQEDGFFGAEVAIVQGSPTDHAFVSYGSGSIIDGVDVFQGFGGSWSLHQTIPSLGAPDDDFGHSIDVWQSLAVIGAPDHPSAANDGPGAAFVYRRQGAFWQMEHSLVPIAGAQPASRFGESVAARSNRVVVGAPEEDTGLGVGDEGAAYVFEPTGFQSWQQTAHLISPNLAESFGYGRAVAIGGLFGHLAVSEVGETGRVHVYGNGLVFPLIQTITSPAHVVLFPGFSVDGFGGALGLSGNRLVVGDEMNPSFGTSGAAFVFELPYAPEPLLADFHAISLEEGGSQHLQLDAGPSEAGKIYWILGTASGTFPGTVLANAALPLNPDGLFTFLLTSPFPGFLGLLDAEDGTASASFYLPPNSDPSLAGVTIHWAYITLGTGPIDFVSNAEPLTLGL